MFPCLSTHDAIDHALADSKLLSQGALRNRPSSVELPDFRRIIIAQLALFQLCAMSAAALCSALVDHILHVILVSPNPEVSRVNAGGIIAIGAVVANKKTIRNWTNV